VLCSSHALLYSHGYLPAFLTAHQSATIVVNAQGIREKKEKRAPQEEKWKRDDEL